MNSTKKNHTFGIEEEYLLVDRETRDLPTEIPVALLADLKESLGDQFSREYMRAQIEIATPVCTKMVDARPLLAGARRRIARIAGAYGLTPMAASTHPFTHWRRQHHTDLPRYNDLADDLQGLGRRMIVNGLHVHVRVATDADRIRLMNEVRPFLPILLALSTSSPFWQGEATGLKSYRTAVNDSTPRKGIPETFNSWRDYERTVNLLRTSGVIEDASKIWWDIRPSAHYPTVEMRITDVCPLVDDSVCLAALFRCLCHHISHPEAHGKSRDVSPTSLTLVNENRWRAQRYGIDAGLIDYQSGEIVPLADGVDALLALIREDAYELDCVAEVEHALTILQRGTSADRQIACFKAGRAAGKSPEAALAGVVDEITDETVLVSTRTDQGFSAIGHPAARTADVR